jgi:hypothetical protein
VDEQIHRFLDRAPQMLACLGLGNITEGGLVAFRPQWAVHRWHASVRGGINPAVAVWGIPQSLLDIHSGARRCSGTFVGM